MLVQGHRVMGQTVGVYSSEAPGLLTQLRDMEQSHWLEGLHQLSASLGLVAVWNSL